MYGFLSKAAVENKTGRMNQKYRDYLYEQLPTCTLYKTDNEKLILKYEALAEFIERVKRRPK